MTNHIIAPVHDHRNQELRHIIKKNNVNILVAVQTHVIVQFTKTVQFGHTKQRLQCQRLLASSTI